MSSGQATVSLPCLQARQNMGSKTRAPRRIVWRRPVPSAVLGLSILVLLVLVAVSGPSLWPLNSEAQDLMNRLVPPWGFGGSLAHPLGTDGLGRDTLARLIAGSRVSLAIAFFATVAAGMIGVTLGMLAGFQGGLSDRVVTWLADVQLAIPFVVFAIVVTAMLGNSLANVLTTLIVTGWVAYARVIRLQTRALRSTEWVLAARAIGAGAPRVLLRHLLPNLVAPVAVLATQQAGAMILYESSLSFLGLGVGGNIATWGGMVALGRDAIFKAPWAAAIPGAAIALAILGFNLTGDWLATRGRRGMSA